MPIDKMPSVAIKLFLPRLDEKPVISSSLRTPASAFGNDGNGRMTVMGMAVGNISLPEPLLAEIQSAARAQQRSPDELVANAVRLYLEQQSWRKFVENNELRARARGIGESDVDRFIAETRAGNQQCGR